MQQPKTAPGCNVPIITTVTVKSTWEQDIWFKEYIHELEYTKGFYERMYFNNWEKETSDKINRLRNQNWSIEKLKDFIK